MVWVYRYYFVHVDLFYVQFTEIHLFDARLFVKAVLKVMMVEN